MIISFRCFGTTYRSHTHRSRILTLEDGADRLFRNVCMKLPLLVTK